MAYFNSSSDMIVALMTAEAMPFGPKGFASGAAFMAAPKITASAASVDISKDGKSFARRCFSAASSFRSVQTNEFGPASPA